MLLLTEFTFDVAASSDAVAADWGRGGRDEDEAVVVEAEVEVEGKREECGGGELAALLGLLGTG